MKIVFILQSLDISKYKPLQSISKRVVESEKYLSQVKIPLKSIPKYNLGDTIPAEDAKHILVVTRYSFLIFYPDYELKMQSSMLQ